MKYDFYFIPGTFKMLKQGKKKKAWECKYNLNYSNGVIPKSTQTPNLQRFRTGFEI